MSEPRNGFPRVAIDASGSLRRTRTGSGTAPPRPAWTDLARPSKASARWREPPAPRRSPRRTTRRAFGPARRASVARGGTPPPNGPGPSRACGERSLRSVPRCPAELAASPVFRWKPGACSTAGRREGWHPGRCGRDQGVGGGRARRRARRATASPAAARCGCAPRDEIGPRGAARICPPPRALARPTNPPHRLQRRSHPNSSRLHREPSGSQYEAGRVPARCWADLVGEGDALSIAFGKTPAGGSQNGAAISGTIGCYEIRERIGAGGFASVFRAWDATGNREVAIKACTLGPEMHERFFREAELAGRLHHPNITEVYESGMEGDTPYIVQELLGGEDLSALIARREPNTLSEKI